MKDITWDDFTYKNRNKTGSFEHLCRNLFLRTIKKSGSDYQYNFNQAGLEIEPIQTLIDGEVKWVGAQCKFFTTENSNAQYQQIFKSVETAITKYKGKLDYIYIYTNAPLQPICTDDEIKKSKTRTPRIKLNELHKKAVKLHWQLQDNILDLVREANNIDLRRIYFSEEREIEWTKDALTLDERTFLSSFEFYNLKLNDINISDLNDSIIQNKTSLLLGAAGTGKSFAMKKLYLSLEHNFTNMSTCTTQPLPIFIKLRECINGNLESLLRQRLTDYNLNNIEADGSFFYFFDGLDEVSHYNIGSIVNHINALSSRTTTKSILISSRTDSNNLSHLNQHLKCIEYKISPLLYSDIKSFFVAKNNDQKLEKLQVLYNTKARVLENITDIFSVNLIWKVIENIETDITNIDIITQYVNHWIDTYVKLADLSLLEPKKKSILELCKQISCTMQSNLQLNISLPDVQKIVINFGKASNSIEINNIVSSLIDLFFEISANASDQLLSYKHRRFHEYFLYLSIDESFIEHPEQLREYHLLSNKDFMINVFFKTSLSNAIKANDVLKVHALRLLEQYLGYSYWHAYQDDSFCEKFAFGSKEPIYAYSVDLPLLISHYNTDEIKHLLNNESLSIGDFITKENCLKFIEFHHKYKSGDIVEFIFNKYPLPKDKIVTHKNFYSFLYIQNRMRNVSLEQIYSGSLADSKFLHPEIGHMDYVDSSNEFLNAFYKYCIEFEVDYITRKIPEMSIEQIEILSFQLLKYNNILCLLSKEPTYLSLRKQFINRIESDDSDYLTNTIAVYCFLSHKTQNYSHRLNEALDKANCRNYPSWHQNIELHNLLCYLLKGNFSYALSEFKLGASLLEHLFDNYDNLDNVLNLWLDDIKPFNYVWNNWLQYTFSNMVGTLVSMLPFDPVKLKSFLRELMKYESVIYSHVIYYSLLKHNPRLYHMMANRQIIERMIHGSLSSKMEYESSSEFFFQYALMYWNIDKEKSYALLIDGINNHILRPPYKGEQLMSMIMPSCLYFSYHNFIHDEYKIKEQFQLLFDFLENLGRSTDNSSPYNCFKWALKACIGEDNLIEKLYDTTETNLYPISSKCISNAFDFSTVTADNISDFYSFKCEDAPYDSIDFWQKIIDINYSYDKELSTLYTVLEKIYPSMYGYSPIIDYIYLPVAVLLADKRTQQNFIKFSMKHGGEYGFYNLIRAYSIIGKSDEAKKFIDFLFSFLTLLTISQPNKTNFETQNGDYPPNWLEQLYNSTPEDWNYYDNKCICMFKKRSNFKIIWDEYDEREPFNDKWATNHPDKHAYISNYVLLDNELELKHFSLVHVDGYRAAIPLPKVNTNVIRRTDYFFSRLFNTNIETLHSYIIRSGLIIE